MVKKKYIGILDGGNEGINLFEDLCNYYPSQPFVYVNDLDNYPYEDKETSTINKLVQKSVELLLTYDLMAIIVVNNSIIEYCDEYLKSLKVPVIYINEAIIEYVNANYEHKNILFLAKQYIIKAYLYQKNMHYNHLYSIPTDELENLIINKAVKTAQSFDTTENVFKGLKNRDIDLLVMTDSFLVNLMIEFKEYLNIASSVNLLSAIETEIKKKNIEIYTKSKAKNIIVSPLLKKDYYSKVYWLNKKYNYIRRIYE